VSAHCRFAVASMLAPSSPNHVVKVSCDSAMMSDIAWSEVLSDMLVGSERVVGHPSVTTQNVRVDGYQLAT
jgi:hypothetical protein